MEFFDIINHTSNIKPERFPPFYPLQKREVQSSSEQDFTQEILTKMVLNEVLDMEECLEVVIVVMDSHPLCSLLSESAAAARLLDDLN